MLAEKKLTQFLDDLASDLPAPGGGGAAAVSGAMGACLIAMTARLTLGKQGYEEVWQEMEQVINQSDLLHKELLALADEDASAFNEVIAALKMPRENAGQIKLRTEALQKAFAGALQVPSTVAQKCHEVLGLAWQIAATANANLISDIGVAAQLSGAGLESSLLNVRINLPYIKDEEFVKITRKQIESLAMAARETKTRILSEVEAKIN